MIDKSFEALRDREPAPRLNIIATGAGADFLHRLWSVPGISRVLASAAFPYANSATIEKLGFTPEKFVSPRTAISLAQRAYMDGLGDIVATAKGPVVGIGITASVASLVEHRGEPRVAVAAVTPTGTWAMMMALTRGVGAEKRAADDIAVTEVVLALLEHALTGGAVDGADEIAKNIFFEHPVFRANGDRQEKIDGDDVCMPGAFDPLHFGHLGLAMAAEHASGRNVLFEITADPPHKEAPSVQVMLERAHQFRRTGRAVFFSRGAPLYIDKARRAPGSAFVIGVDTLDRILDPKWCSVEPMLDEFEKLGTKFYVASRDNATVESVLLRRRGRVFFRDVRLFTPVAGRWDVSSTDLRALRGGKEVPVVRTLRKEEAPKLLDQPFPESSWPGMCNGPSLDAQMDADRKKKI